VEVERHDRIEIERPDRDDHSGHGSDDRPDRDDHGGHGSH